MSKLEFLVTFSRAARNWSARIRSDANTRSGHWGARQSRVKMQRKLVTLRWLVTIRTSWPRLRPRVPALVTLTRIGPGRLDDDNLIRGFKAVRDQVAGELGVDDKDRRIKWQYSQRRGGRGFHAMTVSVEWRDSGSRWLTWDDAADLEVVREQPQQELPIAAHGCAEEVAF